MQDIAGKEDCSMPARLAARIAEKSGRNLRRAVLLAESCRVQQPTLHANQDIQVTMSLYNFRIQY
jgi:replication factor C subunit 3/5